MPAETGSARAVRIPPPVRRHLRTLAGPYGLTQFSRGSQPVEATGTCTDDVARAALVDLAHARVSSESGIDESLTRNLAFLATAFERPTGRFRNLLRADHRWDPSHESDDATGRAIQALGAIAAHARSLTTRERAAALLGGSLRAGRTMTAIRPQAYVLLGCVEALAAEVGGRPARSEIVQTFDAMLTSLLDACPDGDAVWPWPEDVVTYDNGVIPQALVEAGGSSGTRRSSSGARSCCCGWPPRRRRLRVTRPSSGIAAGGREMANGPGSTSSRSKPARSSSRQRVRRESPAIPRSGQIAERFYRWFLGDNDLGIEVAVPDRGACRDGLEAGGLNRNEGAESTIVWLLATEAMRSSSRQDDTKAEPGEEGSAFG